MRQILQVSVTLMIAFLALFMIEPAAARWIRLGDGSFTVDIQKICADGLNFGAAFAWGDVDDPDVNITLPESLVKIYPMTEEEFQNNNWPPPHMPIEVPLQIVKQSFPVINLPPTGFPSDDWAASSYYFAYTRIHWGNAFDVSVYPYVYVGFYRYGEGSGEIPTGMYLIQNCASVPSAAPTTNYYTLYSPILTWGAVSWATGYDVEVATGLTFTDPYRFTAPGSVPSLQTPIGLSPGKYYWRVRALENSTPGLWSAVQSFVIDPPG